MGPRRLRQVIALIVALAAAVIGLEGRGYPWSLAAILGAACGAFVWVLLERIGEIAAMFGDHHPPREDEDRRQQREMDPPAEDHSGAEGYQPGREQAEGEGQPQELGAHDAQSNPEEPLRRATLDTDTPEVLFDHPLMRAERRRLPAPDEEQHG